MKIEENKQKKMNKKTWKNRLTVLQSFNFGFTFNSASFYVNWFASTSQCESEPQIQSSPAL